MSGTYDSRNSRFLYTRTFQPANSADTCQRNSLDYKRFSLGCTVLARSGGRKNNNRGDINMTQLAKHAIRAGFAAVLMLTGVSSNAVVIDLIYDLDDIVIAPPRQLWKHLELRGRGPDAIRYQPC